MLGLILFYFSFVILHCLFHLNNTQNGNKHLNNIEIVVVFILLFAYFGFRDLHVLNDTNHYYLAQLELLHSTRFNESKLFFIDKNNAWQPGFQIIQCLIGKLWANPYALIMVSAFIVIVVTLWFASRYTSEIALFSFFLLGLGILNGQISAMRQGWAMACFYISLYSCQKNKKFIAIVCLILAYFFHSSAIILLIYFALTFLKISKKNVSIVILAGITIVVFLYPVLRYIGFGDSTYLISASERQTIALASILTSLLQLFIIVIGYYMHKKYDINLADRFIIWGVVLSLLLNIASIEIQVFSRFSIYFGIFQILYLFYYLSNCPLSVKRNILFLMILILLLRTGIVNEFRNDWSHLIPYSFFDFSEGVRIRNFGY